MFDLLFSLEALPFSIALSLMLGLILLEASSVVLGSSLSSFFDNLLPPHLLNASQKRPEDSPSFGTRLLSWVHFGKISVLAVIILFLASFGLLGLCIQYSTLLSFQSILPSGLAALAALLLTLPVMHFGGALLTRFFPKADPNASSEDLLIGQRGVIVLAGTDKEDPGEAQVRDPKGHLHKLRVVPNDPQEVFEKGATIEILERIGSLYVASPASKT